MKKISDKFTIGKQIVEGLYDLKEAEEICGKKEPIWEWEWERGYDMEI